MLESRLATEDEQLGDNARDRTVVLPDYETNGDADDLSPLSHAALVRCFVEGSWPHGGES